MWKNVVTKSQKKMTEAQEKWELQAPAALEGETELSQIQVRYCEHTVPINWGLGALKVAREEAALFSAVKRSPGQPSPRSTPETPVITSLYTYTELWEEEKEVEEAIKGKAI